MSEVPLYTLVVRDTQRSVKRFQDALERWFSAIALQRYLHTEKFTVT